MKNYPAKIVLVVVMALLAVVFFYFSDNSENPNEPVSDAAVVERVIDGDTITISRNGEETTVRLLGINTPESTSPYRTEECFGKEAADYLKTLLPLGSLVTVETDTSQDTYDKYNRLLGYVFLRDININEQLITDGYAYEYTYRKPYRYQGVFRAAERKAQKEDVGLWKVCK